jgi:uncharacterized OB-fold protein
VGRINYDTLPVWEAWQRHELRFAHCQDCGTWIHFPRLLCPTCWSVDIGFDPVAGSGRVLTWSLPRQAPDALPVVSALIAMDGAEGVHLLARLVDCAPDDVEFGMPVKVDWSERGDVSTPVFRPSQGAA